jgi:phosphoglycolate phosphatase-like HAD superfamily hydrolase
LQNINLIFDFDGTLVDSFDKAVETFNQLADEFRFKKAELDKIPELKHLTSRELIGYFNIPLYKIPKVLLRARALIRDDLLSLPTFGNMNEILAALFEMNVGMGILTSNSTDNVHSWLERNNLRRYFSFIHEESTFFGKARVLRKIIKSNSLKDSLIFYVGDETRDIDAAKSCNLKSVAVTWGFNSGLVLSKHEPHHLVHQPDDLLRIIKDYISR